MPDPEYLTALRATASHGFSCSCSQCEIVHREDGKARRPEFDEECEVPGCTRRVTEYRPQSSGDVLRVCGLPHVYSGSTEAASKGGSDG